MFSTQRRKFPFSIQSKYFEARHLSVVWKQSLHESMPSSDTQMTFDCYISFSCAIVQSSALKDLYLWKEFQRFKVQRMTIRSHTSSTGRNSKTQNSPDFHQCIIFLISCFKASYRWRTNIQQTNLRFIPIPSKTILCRKIRSPQLFIFMEKVLFFRNSEDGNR